MPFRFSVEYDPRFLESVQEQLDNIPTLAYEVMGATLDDIREPLLQELRYTPDRRSYPSEYPLEWTSEAQRRAYFATDGFGGGIPYNRTGKMQNSWRVFIAKAPDGGKFTVFNEDKKAKYVVGTLAKNDSVAYGQIQRFHTITGWQKAKPTALFWFEAYLESLETALLEKIGNAIVRAK